MAIAETYDIIVTIPEGQLEIAATTQDGSGHSSIRLGQGHVIPAQVFNRPNKIEMMKDMSKMDMKMGAPSLIGNKKKYTPQYLMQKYGMHMSHTMNMHDIEMDKMESNPMEHKNDSMHMHHEGESENMEMNPKDMTHDSMHSEHKMEMQKHEYEHEHEQMSEQMEKGIHKPLGHEFNYYSTRKTYFSYDFLKSDSISSFNSNIPIRKLLLNLTGNMNRYVWSLNGIPLSETDNISIKKGEVTQITFYNLTMMHHPMHLHGHYFRVINENGERSPLKHTVNIAPMQKVVIEFYNEEYGDWIFHCHVLYHMMSGMTRIFSYNTPRDPRMKDFPEKTLIKENNPYYTWVGSRLGSNFTEINATISNIRNEFALRSEFDYSKNSEVELSYNRYVNDWVRVYAAVKSENETPNSFNNRNTEAFLGVKYFTPYMFNLDLSLDQELRPRIRLDRELLLFPKLFLEGEL